MKNEHKKNLDRRDFLKVLGGAAAVTSATLLPGCKNKQESAYTATTDIPTDQMTYRINPSTQDRVSLLGYGCMRWPTVSNNSARDSIDDIDQETVSMPKTTLSITAVAWLAWIASKSADRELYDTFPEKRLLRNLSNQHMKTKKKIPDESFSRSPDCWPVLPY